LTAVMDRHFKRIYELRSRYGWDGDEIENYY